MSLFLLIFYFVSASALLDPSCKISYKFRSVCRHYSDECYGRESECQPVRTSFNNAHCPVADCV